MRSSLVLEGVHLQMNWPHGGDVAEGIQVSPMWVGLHDLDPVFELQDFVKLQIRIHLYLVCGAGWIGAFRNIPKKLSLN